MFWVESISKQSMAVTHCSQLNWNSPHRYKIMLQTKIQNYSGGSQRKGFSYHCCVSFYNKEFYEMNPRNWPQNKKYFMVIFWSSFHNPLSTKKKQYLKPKNGWRNFCIFKTIWSNVTSKFKACVCVFWTACCLASCFPKHTGRQIKSTDRDISSHQSLVSQNPLPKYYTVVVSGDNWGETL